MLSSICPLNLLQEKGVGHAINWLDLMTPEQFREVETLFFKAQGVDAAELDAFVERSCEDPLVKSEVKRLLAQERQGEATLTINREVAKALAEPSPRRSNDPDLPRTVGNYQLVREVGHGGMGVVYEAQQLQPIRRRVALKLIKLGMDTEAFVARFESERQALALMDHPNVAHIYDAGATDKGRPYYVMEFVAGVPITEHCDRNRLSIHDRLALFMQVCEGVQHAHQKGIIHRDLKPGNILVASEEDQAVPKVIDFGVAKAIHQRLTEYTFATERGQLVGTPAYMSPEQVDAATADIDTRSDIYALGTILYELLVAVLPFDHSVLKEASYSEIVRIIKEVEPVAPSRRLKEDSCDGRSVKGDFFASRQSSVNVLTRALRNDLDWVVMKCLEKKRSRRYDTVSALRADLQRFLNHEPLEAGPPSTAYRLRKYARRHQAALGAVTTIAIVLILSTVLSSWLALRATRAEELAERRLASEQQARAETELARDAERVQRLRAEREGTKAVRVAQFSQNIINAVTPGIAQAHDTTLLRLMFEQAANRIDKMQDAGPEIEGALRDVLGRSYQAIGEYTKAKSQYESAIGLRREATGPSSRETLSSRHNLAYTLQEMGDLDQAEAIFNDVLEQRTQQFGKDDQHTVQTIINLAIVARQRGDITKAKQLCRQVLAHEARLGSFDESVLQAKINLANALQNEGQLTDAKQLYLEALDALRATVGDSHPNVIDAANNYGACLYMLNESQAALPVLESALERSTVVFGPSHVTTLSIIGNLAEVHRRLGNAPRARELYLESFARHEEAVGKLHPNTLIGLNNYCEFLLEQGETTEALSKTRELVKHPPRGIPDDHWLIGVFQSTRGQALVANGDWSAGEAKLVSAYQLLSSGLGDAHEYARAVAEVLASAYESREQHEIANKWRTRAAIGESSADSNG